MRVALVVMPFLAADRPSLAAGLLQSLLKQQRGIACDAKYFNTTFSKLLGPTTYGQLADTPTTVFAGEWAFSQAYYGQQFSNWSSYQQEVLDCPIWGVSADQHRLVQDLLSMAPRFLRIALESNDWSKYDLVGFTSTFEQTMPALCLARLIHDRYPAIKIAFGGANFEAGMGEVYLRHFPFIDYVCTGEGDVCFPQLCEHLRDGSNVVPPGILHRGRSSVGARPERFVDLDALPFPDYDDFYRAYAANGLGDIPPFLPVEASRGCWWGERSHCTFCGLNGDTMAFRKKTWTRVAAELHDLAGRYPAGIVQFTDNILAMEYFKDLLPYWAGAAPTPHKFFEVKSNLKREQVDLLREAGVVSIQAGIESLADDTLTMMKKGVSAAQNVALLRWTAERGVDAHWNLIFGFPGEPATDYQTNLRVMKQIVHLSPPDACAPIRMDRFSPNFVNWRTFGFSAVRPMPAYRHIFPFTPADLEAVAYYFAYDHAGLRDVLERSEELVNFGNEWPDHSSQGTAGTLAVRPKLGGGYLLLDSRMGHQQRTRMLTDDELCLLLACDGPTTPDKALARVVRDEPGGRAEDIVPLFEALVRDNVIGIFQGRALTLALLPADLMRGQLRRAA